ncbi:MAG: hypothetical protein ACFN4S_00170 [Prevotella conceptionensis]
MKKITAITICILFAMSLVLLITSACANRVNTVQDGQETYRYTVVDKHMSVGAYLKSSDLIFAASTKYTVVFRAEDGDIISKECSASNYYTYEVGKTYVFDRKLHWWN